MCLPLRKTPALWDWSPIHVASLNPNHLRSPISKYIARFRASTWESETQFRPWSCPSPRSDTGLASHTLPGMWPLSQPVQPGCWVLSSRHHCHVTQTGPGSSCSLQFQEPWGRCFLFISANSWAPPLPALGGQHQAG